MQRFVAIIAAAVVLVGLAALVVAEQAADPSNAGTRRRRPAASAPARGRLAAGGLAPEARAGVRPARLRDGAARRRLPPVRRREDGPHPDREGRRPARHAVPRHLRPGLARRRAGPALDGLRPALRDQPALLRRLHEHERRHARGQLPRVSSADPDSAAASSARVILRVDQPYANHNGGQLQFGPGRPALRGHGRRRQRRRPAGPRPGPAQPAGQAAAHRRERLPGARSAIYAKGLRNPWRFSFDRTTGALWIGDVGQNAWEEIDYLRAGRPAGANLGWNGYEGTHVYNAAVAAAAEQGVADVAGRAVRPQPRVLGDRRLRVPRPRDPGAARLLPVRRLRLRARVGQERARRRARARSPGPTAGSRRSRRSAQDARGELYVVSLGGRCTRSSRPDTPVPFDTREPVLHWSCG